MYAPSELKIGDATAKVSWKKLFMTPFCAADALRLVRARKYLRRLFGTR